MKMETTKNWVDKARYLHGKGLGYSAIATALGLTYHAVRYQLDEGFRNRKREIYEQTKKRAVAVSGLAANEAAKAPETREETIARLRAEGWGWERIARKVGLSPSGAQYIGDAAYREKMKAHNRQKHREKVAAQRAAWGQPSEPAPAPADLFYTTAPAEPEPKPAAFSAEIRALREQGLGWADIASVFGSVYFRLRTAEQEPQ